MSRLKSNLSYSNVVATIAIFLALGGGAYAAIKIPKKSVGAKQLKANAVTNPKIANGAVTSGKIAPGQAVKDIAVREVIDDNVGAGAFSIQRPACLAGETAIAGGGGFTVINTRNYSNNDIETVTRTNAPIDANDDAATAGSVSAVAWLVSAQNAAGAARDFHAYVVCAKK